MTQPAPVSALDLVIEAAALLVPEALTALHAPGPVVTMVRPLIGDLADLLKAKVRERLAVEQLPPLLVPEGASLERALAEELAADARRMAQRADTLPPPADDLDNMRADVPDITEGERRG